MQRTWRTRWSDARGSGRYWCGRRRQYQGRPCEHLDVERVGVSCMDTQRVCSIAYHSAADQAWMGPIEGDPLVD